MVGVMQTRLSRLLAGLVLIAAAAACSDSSGELSTGEGEPAAGSGALAFAQCMRENGVEDFPDPQIDPGSNRVIATPSGIDFDDPQVQAAQEACQGLAEGLGQGAPPGGEIDEERQAEINDAVLAFAQCMREHGIDFPDPQVNGGRVIMGGPQAAGGPQFDPNSPEFQEAQQECREVLTEAFPEAAG